MAGVSILAFFFDVSAVLESIGTDRVPIFDRPVSGRETLSQLVFVLALHFVQHLDGSPPGHGQPVQTHCCSYLQPQRWPTSAHAMSRPGSDDSPGSSPLAAPAAAAEDARDQEADSRVLSGAFAPGKGVVAPDHLVVSGGVSRGAAVATTGRAHDVLRERTNPVPSWFSSWRCTLCSTSLPPSLFLCWRLAFYGFQSFQIQLEAHGCP